MKCVICGNDNKWKNVDHYRERPAGMCMCEHCGFISYPEKWKSEEEIKQYYRNDYRKPPTAQNLFAGQRKIFYHAAFLHDVFDKWQKENKSPVVCEIGAAYGLFLAFIKSNFPTADINGTELTTAYRRNAYHEFGIELSEDFDKSKKYDFIASYKVAEHILDIDKHLRDYAVALKDDGYFYISVPCWFGQLSNFGTNGIDLEYYYHTNHVNVWSENNFRNLLAQSGLMIVKENHCFYGDTFLCKRNDALLMTPHQFDDPKVIIDNLDRVKKAVDCYQQQRFAEAVQLWPNFPLAWIGFYETRRAELHRNGGLEQIQEQILKPAIASCPNAVEVIILAADIMMRYDKFKIAIQYLDQALKMSPENSAAYDKMSNCYRLLAEKTDEQDQRLRYIAEARGFSKRIRDTAREFYGEAVTRVYADNARLPIPSEMRETKP